MLGVGLLLTIGTGLFVASEFALVNLDRAELEKRQAAGESRLSLTISALRITSTHLSSAQLGITLTTLLTGYTMEPAISSLLAPVFTSWGLPSGVVAPVSVFIGVAIATILSMILGELVPKNFALALPRQTAKLVMPFQVAFTTVPAPADGGSGVDEFLASAESADVDLIVLGIRHRTPVGKLILGSTEQQILLDATGPVLAVKA